MAEYGKVYKKFWNNIKVRSLSDPAKLLLTYLYSCPHANTIGLFLLSKHYICGDLGWTADQLDGPFTELIKTDFIAYDDSTRVIFLSSWFEHNDIDSPNQYKKAEAELSEVPSSVIFQRVIEIVEGLPEGLPKGLLEPLRKGLPKGLGKGLPKPLPKGLPYSESETESETETEAQRGLVPAAPAADPPFREIVDKFHQLCPGLPKVQKLTQPRIQAIRNRTNENPIPDFWESLFRRVQASPFLTGDNNRGWKADFDFILKPESITKIMEGSYDGNNRRISNATATKTGGITPSSPDKYAGVAK